MAEKWFDLIKSNYIYIYHNGEDGEYVLIPNYPDQIQDSMTSTYASQNALSRSAPVYSYSYSGPRTVSISVDLHRDMLDLVNVDVSNLAIDNIEDDYVDTIVKRLQSISVPKYDNSTKAVQPPMVAVRFGNEVFIKGIVQGNITVSYNKPILRGNRYAQVTLGFNIVETDPYDAATIAEQGSFRGITKTWLKGPFN